MMNKEVTFICTSCKESSSSTEGQSKNYRWINEFDFPPVCSKCIRNFYFGYAVTDQQSATLECRTSCERSINSPSECVDICKESRFENQGENDKPNQSYKRTHKCNVSGSSYKHKKSLTIHKKKHIDLNDLRCKVCNKNFSCKSHLDRHMLKYTHLKPHKCTICNLACKEERSLKRHMLTHSDNNPFKCKQCNKKCSSKSNLVIHMAKHSDERPHKCSRCSAAYKLKFHLTRHMKICNDIIKESNI